MARTLKSQKDRKLGKDRLPAASKTGSKLPTGSRSRSVDPVDQTALAGPDEAPKKLELSQMAGKIKLTREQAFAPTDPEDIRAWSGD